MFPTKFLSCLIGLILFSQAAMAQSETVVATSYLGTAGLSTNFQLPGFNTDLGTLDSIDITLKVNLCPVVSVYNSTSAAVQFTNAGISVPVSVGGPAGLDLNLTLNAATAQVNPQTAQPGINTFALDRTSTFDSAQVDPTAFALWENQTNKVSLALTPGSPTFKGTALGNGLFFGGSSTEWGEISVVYNYLTTTQAVPEPSGFYLSLIVGMGMILLVIERRKKLRA